jgi:murein DD-endopeptidase MepM/ murein hydrolase activator NlpD
MYRTDARRPVGRRPFGRRLVAAITGAGLLLGLVVSAAQGDDLDDRKAAAERQAQKIEAQREGLQANLEDTSAVLSKAVLALNTIQAQLPVAQADLDIANAKVVTTQREQQALAERLADAQTEEKQLEAQVSKGATQVAAAHDDVAEMARQSMRGEGALTSLGVVTGAQSTQQFVEDYAIAKTVERTQGRHLADLQDTEAVARNRSTRLTAVREQVADLKSQADEKVAEAQQAQKSAADQKVKVQGLLADQKAKNAAIAKEKAEAQTSVDQNASDTAKAQQEVATLAKQIKARNAAAEKKREEAARKAAAEAKKHHSSGGSGGGSGSSGGGSGGGGSGSGGQSSGGQSSTDVASGVLAWPVANSYVTSPFGLRMHPILHRLLMHTGVDLHAPCGTPIHAAAPGTVVYASWNGGYGNRVIVDHGLYHGHELFTTYNHMERYAAHVGQRVSQGTTVGYAGDFGLSTACHLHFEVMEDGTFENPMNFISATDPF